MLTFSPPCLPCKAWLYCLAEQTPPLSLLWNKRQAGLLIPTELPLSSSLADVVVIRGVGSKLLAAVFMRPPRRLLQCGCPALQPQKLCSTYSDCNDWRNATKACLVQCWVSDTECAILRTLEDLHMKVQERQGAVSVPWPPSHGPSEPELSANEPWVTKPPSLARLHALGNFRNVDFSTLWGCCCSPSAQPGDLKAALGLCTR